MSFSPTLHLKNRFSFSQDTLIKSIHCKKFCRFSHSKTNHIKQYPRFYQISPYLADILHENREWIKIPFILSSCQIHQNLPCIYKLATIAEGDPKAPFSIATTPRYRGERYSFPWIVPLTLDLHFRMLSVKEGGMKYHFLSLWYGSTRDWTLVSLAIAKQSAKIYVIVKYIKSLLIHPLNSSYT